MKKILVFLYIVTAASSLDLNTTEATEGFTEFGSSKEKNVELNNKSSNAISDKDATADDASKGIVKPIVNTLPSIEESKGENKITTPVRPKDTEIAITQTSPQSALEIVQSANLANITKSEAQLTKQQPKASDDQQKESLHKLAATESKKSDLHSLILNRAKTTDKISLDHRFSVSDAKATFTAGEIRPDQIYKLNLDGFSNVIVEIHDNKGHMILNHEVVLGGEGGCVVPITPELLEGNYLMKVFTKEDDLLATEALLTVVDYLEMDFNNTQYVITHFVHTLHYKVKNPKKYIKEGRENRIQFIMETSLETQELVGDETVEMFINKESSFPTTDSYQLKASGSLGYGLIKSLSPKNQYYCVSDDCDYFITIFVVAVDFINFFPTIFANESEIRFNTYFSLIEEVEAGELVTYKLITPKYNGDWLFSIIPTEGKPDFYINPDTKPMRIEEYKYKAIGNGPENILITHKESQSFNFTHEVFYVTYKSASQDLSATFTFETKRIEPNKRLFIKENHLSSGVVAKEEVVNYYMNLQNKEPNTFSVHIDLTSLSGNADLYVKECAPGESDCAVTETDIQNAKNTYLPAAYAGKIFRFSASNTDGSSKKKDQLLLNVNCSGRDGPDYNFKPNPHYPNSASCMFAVGVHCRDSNNIYGTLYRLVTYGNNSIEPLKVFESTSIKVLADDKKNYEVDLNYQLAHKYTYAVFRVYSLTGSCNLYVSQTTNNPNQSDYESALEIRSNDLNTLSTNASTLFVSLQTNNKNSIYMSVVGYEYCIFDIYVDLVHDINEAESSNERLRINKMVHRHIKYNNYTMDGSKKIFYNSFYLDLPYDLHHSKDIDIALDSDMMGLEICVQLDRTEYNSKIKCDFQSSSETLSISNNNNDLKTGKIMAVTILKYEDKVPKPVFFPIEFRIMVSLDNVEKNGAELLMIGKSHSKVLSPGDSISYTLHLTKMNKKGLVILTGDSPAIRAEISNNLTNTGPVIAKLDYSKFAMRINNAETFKNLHCQPTSCEIYVKITNAGLFKTRYTLTYTIDDIPITIREGTHIFVPADKEQYFITKPNVFTPLSFNINTEKTSSVIYAQLFEDHELKHFVFSHMFTENKFDYKSHIDTEAQVVISPDIINERHASGVGYLVVPKFDVSTHYSDVVIYGQDDKMSISLHSKMRKLAGSSQLSGHVVKGDFSYYYMHIDEPVDFNVILNVLSGEADLYINPGMYNLTTTQYFWKKRTTFKDDELLITADMFNNPNDMIGSYTIGVYARETSDFLLRYAQMDFNVIKLHYQRMVDVNLTKDKYFYFDFYNKHEKFNSLLYAEDSDVDVSVLNYDEKAEENFLEMIYDETNYIQRFTFKKGDVPRKKVSLAELKEQTHYIIRMKATEKDARVTFSIYDKAKPLITYLNKRFTFAQDKEDEQLFMINLDSNYREVDVDIKLEFGSIEFMVDNDIFFKQPKYEMDRPSQKYIKFSVGSLEKSNDIAIFNSVFVRIKARELSKYSILVKPVDKFKTLKALESELIYTDAENYQYLHYKIGKKDIKRINSLMMQIYTVDFYDNHPELLFIPEADVTLDANSPFLPMPIIDYFENRSDRFMVFEIKPEILVGDYVIKVPPSRAQIPLKVSISVNDEKVIEPNGVFSGRIDPITPSMNRYTAYIPEAGEFRFMIESCGGVEIDKAIFTHSHNSTNIEFAHNLAQSVPYLSVNSVKGVKTPKFKTAVYNIRRGIVGGPGLVKFNVTSSSSVSDNKKDLDYYILSEFRPAHKELFMYDYVNLFFTENDSNVHEIVYKFNDQKSPLTVTAPIPHFKDQLFADYPKIKKIKFEFTYSIFVDPNFEAELSRCGIAAAKPYSRIQHVKSRTIERHEINGDEMFEFFFYKNNLNSFKNESTLTFFVSMGISFIESDEDERHISLNNKYASVPYFVLTIPNETASPPYQGFLIVSIIITIVLAFVWFICFKKSSNSSSQDRLRPGYDRGIQEGKKLEMTSVNSTTIED